MVKNSTYLLQCETGTANIDLFFFFLLVGIKELKMMWVKCLICSLQGWCTVPAVVELPASPCWRISHCMTGQLSHVFFLTGLRHLQLSSACHCSASFCLLCFFLQTTTHCSYSLCINTAATCPPRVKIEITQWGIFHNVFPLKLITIWSHIRGTTCSAPSI